MNVTYATIPRQYCRYCAFCIDGDVLYCTNHQKTLSESGIRHANNCSDFALSDLGDVVTGKPYTPRQRRTVQDEPPVKQISMWEKSE